MSAHTASCPFCREPLDAAAERCPHCTSLLPAAPLHRDVPGRLFAGVCAALARRLGWDAVLVRVLFVASLAVTGGLALWVYAAVWGLTPFGPGQRSPARRLIDWLGTVFSFTSETNAS